MIPTDQKIMDTLAECIASGKPCPTNGEFADQIGVIAASTIADAFARLRRAGLVLVNRRGNGRVVTILETGETTVEPPPVIRGRIEKEPIISHDVSHLPRVSRDPCGFCGVRADVGCRHSVPIWRAAA